LKFKINEHNILHWLLAHKNISNIPKNLVSEMFSKHVDGGQAEGLVFTYPVAKTPIGVNGKSSFFYGKD
jgi:hypothetical protein